MTTTTERGTKIISQKKLIGERLVELIKRDKKINERDNELIEWGLQELCLELLEEIFWDSVKKNSEPNIDNIIERTIKTVTDTVDRKEIIPYLKRINPVINQAADNLLIQYNENNPYKFEERGGYSYRILKDGTGITTKILVDEIYLDLDCLRQLYIVEGDWFPFEISPKLEGEPDEEPEEYSEEEPEEYSEEEPERETISAIIDCDGLVFAPIEKSFSEQEVKNFLADLLSFISSNCLKNENPSKNGN